MSDKTCPYFGIAPASFMSMEYCKLKSNEKGLAEDYNFVACTSDKWELCPIILARQRRRLEKELNGF
jgi:hypothetical protein